MIGERIKRGRTAARLSLRELSERVGVSAQAISKYERGLDTPGSEVLIRLARALGVKTEYFLRPVTVNLADPAYRKRTSLGKKTEMAMWARVQEKLERYLEVEELLFPAGRPSFRVPAGLEEKIESIQEVEKVAENLRQAWGLGLDPIENLVEVLEEHGILVVPVEAAQGFDACLTMANDYIPVVVINAGYPGDRQRLSIAHELGHLVLKPASSVDGEKAAFRFAGAFLMPSAKAHEELGRKRCRIAPLELHLLKHKYGMSMQALLYRAMDLGILSQAAAAHYFRDFRARGWHRVEPGDQFPSEVSYRFDRMVAQALAEDVISETRAAELLGIPYGKLGEEIATKHHGLPLTLHH